MDDRPDLGNVMAMMSFAAVVSTGGFSSAATMLGYSKAAVSRQIAKLEQSIGVRLLDRTTRSVTLTPAGREMYARCARIVEEVNEANQVMTGMLSKPRGELKVNAPVVSSLFDLTTILPRFLQTYPDVRLFVNLSDSKVDLLKGRFDVVFWMGDTFDSSLESVQLRSYPMALVAARSYLDRAGRPSAANDLKVHTCIVETHISKVGEWRLSEDTTVAVNRGPLTSNSVRMAREATLEGLGISYLPRFLVEDDIAARRLEVLLPDLVNERIPLHVVFPRGNYALSKVRAFVDFVRAEMADQEEGAAAPMLGLATAI
ncbi:DNA-binding transcriptional LysR family regulator [Novosphingobium capsulatum]|uniref:DNA-binding transcriptional LysR family regulator n=1 Tax=Novosphingobium capsulatum TaxID=13688 RepID=A0ABU1MM22_9SPHN|nr:MULTISPECIES: LysR family transcriptional regulator [Novosphingobium]MDR6511264.1 DNA-binding transcriptional LysR family regulator [Novosphingobium capsulatum]PTR11032.1 LysR family transcriptional regulator [Novosphingobium sp. GV055]PUB03582.1 LysR family transcriptional regulator [Novosphingobium sp. GV061]PUB20037.1 LysR family transcriptional regulator [Novosphingobium sp. GV079]PUB41798.1 LysR family transcriptional regulator [Novosphingobium sp. GV027]